MHFSLSVNSLTSSQKKRLGCREVCSGPLSERIDCGLPRSAIARSSRRGIRWLGKQVAVSSTRHCRVKLPITPRTRTRYPPAVASLARSKARSCLGAVRTGRSTIVRRRCLRRVRFRRKPSSRYPHNSLRNQSRSHMDVVSFFMFFGGMAELKPLRYTTVTRTSPAMALAVGKAAIIALSCRSSRSITRTGGCWLCS